MPRPRYRITAALAYLLFAILVGIVVAAIWLTDGAILP